MSTRWSTAVRLAALVLLTGALIVLAVAPHPTGRHARGTLAVVAVVLALGVGSALVRALLAARPPRSG